MNAKKISALLLAAAMMIPCAAPAQVYAAETAQEETAAQDAEVKAPKYIFLFIGDGMSYPQIQTTNYYLNAIEDDGDDILTSESKLNMMKFPVAGSAQTYDSTSFCPDSASTARKRGKTMRSRKVMAILTAVCMSVSMAGAVNAEENTGADPSTIEKAAEDSNIKIGVLMKTMSDAYSNKLGTAIQDYAEKNYPNAELYLMDGQADIAKQISQAEDIIAKQVDVIILNPQDADGSAQVLNLAADANIPVVEVNTETTSTDYVSYVGSNDSEAGEMMGNYVMEQLGDGGQYAILEGEMGQSAQLLRYQGLEDTILKDDKYECVGTLSANWQRDKAMSTTEDWIGKYPDLKAVICENDDMSMGALQAAEAEGKDLVIIGVDGISDALQAVKDGRLSASVLQDAEGQASAVIDVAVKVGVGEKVESRYNVPFQLITADNVDDYLK